MATNEVYLGMWGRNADELRYEMKLAKTASLRGYQPTLALSYQGIIDLATGNPLLESGNQ